MSVPARLTAWLRASRWARAAVRLAAVALLVLLALRLRTLWDESQVDFSDASVLLLGLAALASLAAVVSYGVVWPFVLRRIGVRAPRGSVSLFLVSQLGKYLPGSVWHYAGRVELARRRGVPVRATVLSLGLEVAASALAAAAVGLFVLPPAFAVPLSLGLVALVLAASTSVARRLVDPVVRGVRHVVPAPVAGLRSVLGALPRMSALYVPVWALYGAAFWLTGRALFAISADDLVFFAATFALGWLAGMAAVFAPGGIGVREAVLVALLAPRVGESEAIVIAGASRLLLTAADLVGAAAAFVLLRLDTRGVGVANEEIENARARAS
jgi:uncharacterized membrane protein YbhN (UPF0104 family)